MSPIISTFANASSKGFSSSSIVKPTVTGGTLTSDATYYYRTFTANGTLTISNASLNCDYRVLGGGGGGGYAKGELGKFSAVIAGGGGGGGGGAIELDSQTAKGGGRGNPTDVITLYGPKRV